MDLSALLGSSGFKAGDRSQGILQHREEKPLAVEVASFMSSPLEAQQRQRRKSGGREKRCRRACNHLISRFLAHACRLAHTLFYPLLEAPQSQQGAGSQGLLCRFYECRLFVCLWIFPSSKENDILLRMFFHFKYFLRCWSKM